MKKNVLFVFPLEKIAGAEKVTFSIIDNLNRNKYNPIILCSDRGKIYQRFKDKGIDIVLSKYVRRIVLKKMSQQLYNYKIYNPFTIIFNLLYFLYMNIFCGFIIFSVINKKNISLIHITIPSTSLAVAIASKIKKVKIVFHAHAQNISQKGQGALFNIMTKLSDKIIAVSYAVKKSLINFRMDPTKISTIYNGINPDKFRNIYDSTDIKKELHMGKINIGLIGRLDKGKGHEVLFQAAVDITKDFPDVKFIIIGDVILEEEKNRRSELESLAKELDIYKYIVFTGYRDDIEKIMPLLDLVVIPSWYEPFSLVALEAMAAGKPAVATDVGGLPEIVIDKYTGILVPPGDAKKLANAIKEILINKELAQNLGQNGQKRVREYFNEKRFVNEILSLYSELI